MRRRCAVILLSLSLVACVSRSGPVPAPGFSLKDLSGNTVTLDALRGHPVFLDFWATWCAPCQISMPLVEAFYKRHKGQGLVVLGMNVDEDPSVVYPFVKRHQIHYPVVLAGASPISESYRVDGIPMFFMIDPQGRIVRRFEGVNEDMPQEWESELQRLLPTPQQ